MHEPEPQRQSSGKLDRAKRERERWLLGRLLYSTLCRSHWGRAIRSGRVEARRNWPQLCGKLCCKLSMENKKKKKIRDTGVVRGAVKGGKRLCAGFLCSFCVYNSGLSSSPPHPPHSTVAGALCPVYCQSLPPFRPPSCAVQWRRRSS